MFVSNWPNSPHCKPGGLTRHCKTEACRAQPCWQESLCKNLRYESGVCTAVPSTLVSPSGPQTPQNRSILAARWPSLQPHCTVHVCVQARLLQILCIWEPLNSGAGLQGSDGDQESVSCGPQPGKSKVTGAALCGEAVTFYEVDSRVQAGGTSSHPSERTTCSLVFHHSSPFKNTVTLFF